MGIAFLFCDALVNVALRVTDLRAEILRRREIITVAVLRILRGPLLARLLALTGIRESCGFFLSRFVDHNGSLEKNGGCNLRADNRVAGDLRSARGEANPGRNRSRFVSID